MSRPAAWRAAAVRHRLGLLLAAVGSGLLLDAAFAPLSWWWAAPWGWRGW